MKKLVLFIIPLLIHFSLFERLYVNIFNDKSKTLYNEDVLITINTKTLILSNLLFSDCSNIQFLLSDSSILKSWMENECNQTTTHFWITIPIVVKGKTQITINYGNFTGNIYEVEGNFIILQNNSICGNDFSMDSNFLNKFPRGYKNFSKGYNNVNPHDHTFTANSIGVTDEKKLGRIGTTGGGNRISIVDHTHTNNGNGLTNNVGVNLSVPMYYGVSFCKYLKSRIVVLPPQSIIFVNEELNDDNNDKWDNWESFKWLNDEERYPYGGDKLNFGGYKEHSHQINQFSFTSDGEEDVFIDNSNVTSNIDVATFTHSHNSIASTSDSFPNDPPFVYVKYLYTKVQQYTTNEKMMFLYDGNDVPKGYKRVEYDGMFLKGTNDGNKLNKTGGSFDHSHDFSLLTNGGSAQISLYKSNGETVPLNDHIHWINGNTDPEISLPSYHNVVILKRKHSLRTVVRETKYDVWPFIVFPSIGLCVLIVFVIVVVIIIIIICWMVKKSSNSDDLFLIEKQRRKKAPGLRKTLGLSILVSQTKVLSRESRKYLTSGYLKKKDKKKWKDCFARLTPSKRLRIYEDNDSSEPLFEYDVSNGMLERKMELCFDIKIPKISEEEAKRSTRRISKRNQRRISKQNQIKQEEEKERRSTKKISKKNEKEEDEFDLIELKALTNMQLHEWISHLDLNEIKIARKSFLFGDVDEEKEVKKEFLKKKFNDWTIEEVCEWLKYIRLNFEDNAYDLYGKFFVENKIDGVMMEVFFLKEKNNLSKILEGLGVDSTFHRNIIEVEILSLEIDRYFDYTKFVVQDKIEKMLIRHLGNKKEGKSFAEFLSYCSHFHDFNAMYRTVRHILLKNETKKKGKKTYKVKFIITENIQDWKIRQVRKMLGIPISVANKIGIVDVKWGMYHAAFSIGGLQLEWVDNSLCLIRSVSSENVILCCDLGFYTTDNVEEFALMLSQECRKWNRDYIYETMMLKQKKFYANCQQFVEYFVIALLNLQIDFSDDVKNFLKILKGKGKTEKTFSYDSEFAKTFGLKSSPFKPKNHEELDKFVNNLRRTNEDFEKIYPGKWQLLKGFDRAYWMRHLSIMKTQKVKDIEMKTEYSPSKEGCPFNSK